MILSIQQDKFIVIAGGDNFIEGDVLNIVDDVVIVRYDDNEIRILDQNGVQQGYVLRKGKYKLERSNSEQENIKKLAYDLIAPLEDDVIEEEGINLDLLRLLTRIKEIDIAKAICEIDINNPDSLINYDKVYNKSKNKDFIPELNPYNLLTEYETIRLYSKIFTLRNTIYEARTDADKNHIVFGLNNPVIWLDADPKIKRVACGAIQYRKGLHIREFDLMVYNLNLLNRFKLDSNKIQYAELMRDYNLL